MTKDKPKKETARKQEGKYVDLPGAKEGEVVVRFPPEASGFLHIGHAKAALLNQYYQLAFKGRLIFRFDDTNPEKEKEDFEEVIREDVALLQIKPDICSYTSDFFDLYIDKIVQLIKEGKAYVDDTPADVMKQEREARTESANRNNSVEKNLQLWQEMVDGTEIGLKCCVRAKIDMSSDNGCMRDPAFYRCKKQAHPRTGSKYNVYPTYDFACPIIDSHEGVTHALRTTEYVDRDIQYYWVLEQLQMRKPYIVSYSRLNLLNTVLSKRKLTWFVENKVVSGWEDPRMPTVRGVLRRGMTVEGLKQFIIAQGSSRAAVNMEWDKIWAFNKKVIDSDAKRFAAVVKNAIPVTVINADDNGIIEVSLHPKNAEMGKRTVKTGKSLLVDPVDAQAMNVGDSVTFVNWGNLKITDIKKSASGDIQEVVAQTNLDDKNFKNTLKSTWVNGKDSVAATFVYYDHLIAKSLLAKEDEFKDFINKNSKFELETIVESAVSSLAKGEIIQVLRKGFFIIDSVSPLTLISIPDGSTDLNIFPSAVRTWKEECLKMQQNFDSAAKEHKTKTSASNVNIDSGKVSQLLSSIKSKGDEIRELKAKKASKDQIESHVKTLQQLKAEFKSMTGTEWTPNAVVPVVSSNGVASSSSGDSSDGNQLDAQIKQQGDQIRELKAAKASQDQLLPLIEKLKGMKLEYKEATGKEWQPPTASTGNRSSGNKDNNKTKQKESAKKEVKSKGPQQQEKKSGDKKQTRLGLETKKADNFADWYTEVITKSEMIEYYDVSGCYILRPWAFSIWESIVSFFDGKIKSVGVENCYFPMFVTQAALEKEKAHIADFAPEVAWVTKSGDTDMPEPIAIRPTSETVMYPAYAKWIQSYRDLPLRLNQWCNVVRWEFKNPTPFLRTREFLWQEGHSAWADKDAAVAEVFQMLDFYAQVYEDLLAVPVVKGKKTEKEKFPGGDFTTTIEGFIAANGRGIQAATSHHLGQNFSKMFEIVFQDPDQIDQKRFAYQNSYGLTTRTIGTMVMTHSDDKGLVLPPKVAAVQVIIIACGITANTTDDDKKVLLDACLKLEETLKSGGIRVKTDLRDHYSPGWKYNHWELKGVPIRIELGPKDLSNQSFVVVRRDDGTKSTVSFTDCVASVSTLLQTIQQTLFSRAKKQMDDSIVVCTAWADFTPNLDAKKLLLSPFCGSVDCEENIKKDSTRDDPSASAGPLMGAKSLCIPLKQPRDITSSDKCIHTSCNRKPEFFTLFGRSY